MYLQFTSASTKPQKALNASTPFRSNVVTVASIKRTVFRLQHPIQVSGMEGSPQLRLIFNLKEGLVCIA